MCNLPVLRICWGITGEIFGFVSLQLSALCRCAENEAGISVGGDVVLSCRGKAGHDCNSPFF